MKRINGFLDLNDYFQNQSLEEDDIRVGQNDWDYWLKIEGIEYYFKITQNPYVELICYEIANFLGMNAVPYDLAIFKNISGVISKSYRKENCDYISGVRILNHYLKSKDNIEVLKGMGLRGKNYFTNTYLPRDVNNLEVIWQAIEQRYNKLGIDIDIEKIMYDLVLLFIFNVLTCQNDGNPQNWELEESPEGVSLVPIFDNEYCLNFDDMGNVFSKLTTNFKDNAKNNYVILEEFLKTSSKDFVDLCIQKFNDLTLEVFLELINIVEEKIGCEIPKHLKMVYIQVFTTNRENISIILDKLELNSNSRK